MDEVAELKNRGNDALLAGRVGEAIECYSSAIALDTNNAVLYSNRSAAYCTDGQYDKGLEDAEKVVQIKPEWFKAYSRKGSALCGLGRFDEAVNAYDQGLELNPFNDALKEGKAEVEREREKASRAPRFEGDPRSKGYRGAKQAPGGPGGFSMDAFFGPDMWEKLGKNDATRFLLADPDFTAKMKDIQANPNRLNEYMGDERIMTAVTVLLGLDEQIRKTQEKKMQEEAKEKRMENEKEKEKEADVESTRSPTQVDALKEKTIGNEFYVEKRVEEALGHYRRAHELDGGNITYLLNIAACLLEMGEYDESVAACEKAVEIGRMNHSDFKLIAKAYARIGNAHMKQKKFEDAIASFEKSQLEHRTEEVRKKIKLAKDLKVKTDQEAYLDDDMAEKARLEGNDFFRNGDFPKAIESYTEGTRRNPRDVRLFSNRAAAYMKVAAFNDALRDCDHCLALDPTFVKGYTRKAQIHFFRKEYHKCLEIYDQVMKMDPNNEEALEGSKRTIDAINRQQNSGVHDEEALQRAMADPEIQQILSDPYMQTVLREMGENPASAQQHLSDPKIRTKIQKLIASGILKTSPGPHPRRP